MSPPPPPAPVSPAPADPQAIALARRGLMLILSSPSGAGKTTIARRLLASQPSLALSVSVTTRPIRPGEQAGRDYHFTSRPDFEARAGAGEFLEWAQVFGNLYGTPRAQIAKGLAEGRDYLFDVDWQGAQQLSHNARADVVSVFVLPPSIAELEHRLRSRRTDSEAAITGRMARARDEISHWDSYDYVVINANVDACFARVSAILEAERMRRTRQTGLVGFTRQLMQA